ncbi:MAG: DNA-3-methyladenine glycosylase 2 family protein [Solirubrobacterales bacterium]|nr:DNA-3-methyladenine glycosylase 2 family protein [Solirubrobacterales bacterium]
MALAAPVSAGHWSVEERAELRPRSPLRLPGPGMDGVTRRRGTVLERALHVGPHPVVLRVAQPAADRVVIGARAHDRDAALQAIAQLRSALGVDVDLRPFVARFRDDPLIGASVRRRPYLRPAGRAEPLEALVWAITEQLIEYVRAVEIQRAMLRGHGRRVLSWDGSGTLVDLPSAATLAGLAPAWLQSCDLSAGRSMSLIRAAREVATGRVDLHAPDHERGWTRLRRIPGIGSWTLDILALLGQRRLDRLPAGDLSYVKLVGRLRADGDPHAPRATEDEVRAFFAPYEEWAGLAGAHALRATGCHRAAPLGAGMA